MISRIELYSALNTAHDYYRSTFFELKTKTTRQQAEQALVVLNKFRENGQQLYDKEYWGLSSKDSICASVGHLLGKWNEIEKYLKFKNYKHEQEILSKME